MAFPFLNPRGPIVEGAGLATVVFRAWINEIQKLLFAVRDSLATASDDLASAEDDILDLQGDVDDLNDDIGDLDTRVDALEALIVVPGLVSALDPLAPVGTRAFVTDADTPVFGAAVLGGGTDKVPVYRTTTDWRVG